MPPVIALVAAEISFALVDAALSAGLSVSVATGIGLAASYAVTTGLNLAVSVGLGELLKPKVPAPESAMTTFRQARPPKQRGYGRYRVSGPSALYDTYQHTIFNIVAINDGQVDAYEKFYLNSDEIAFANPGPGFQESIVQQFPDGRYAKNHVGIAWRYGLDPETSYTNNGVGPGLVLPAQWPATSLGNGTASFMLSATGAGTTQQQTSFPFGIPNPSAVIRASLVFDWRDHTQDRYDPSTWKWSENAVVCLADFLTTPADHGGMGFDYDARIVPVLDMWTAAADDCDSGIPVINWSTFITLAVSGEVGSANPPQDFAVVEDATGIVAGTVINFGSETVTVTSAVPPDQSGTRLNFNRNVTYTYLKGAYVAWTVNDGSATQKRYTLGGYYTYDNDPADVLASILQTFDGWFSTDGAGHLVIYGGKYYAPDPAVQTVPSAAIVGWSFKPYLEDEQAVNQLLLAFGDPAHQWTMTDTDPWLDAADIAARGVERTNDLKLAWVHFNSQARRLAKRAMSRLTAPSGTLTCNLAGVMFLGYRYLIVSIPEITALSDAIIEIKRVKFDLARLQVVFDWVLADPNIDAWNPAVEEGAGPGVGSRNAPAPLPAPTIIAVTPDYVGSTGEGIGKELLITAESPLGDGFDWIAQVSRHGEDTWTSWTFNTVPIGASDTDVELLTGFVQTGELDVQVAYSAGGTLSPWSPVFTLTVQPPSTTTIQVIADENIPAGALTYASGTPSHARLASAVSGGYPANSFAPEAIANGDTGTCNLVGLDAAIDSSINANTVWLSATVPGAYQTTAPDGGTDIVQTVGSVVQTVGLLFNPGVPSGVGLPQFLETEGGIEITTEGGQGIVEDT